MATQVGEASIKLSLDTKAVSSGLNDVQKASDNASKNVASAWEIAAQAIINDVAIKAFGAVTNAAKGFASSVVSVGSGFESSMSEVAAITGAAGDGLTPTINIHRLSRWFFSRRAIALLLLAATRVASVICQVR